MILSDVSIKRPIVCIVLALIILLVGSIAFNRLPVREYPDIESPIVSVDARYPGSAAEVVETQITDPLEEELSSIDGVRIMRSASNPGRGSVNLEFDLRRDINEAANDVRDKVGRVVDRLPDTVDAPQVEKADSDADPIMTLSMNSDRFTRLELAEIADRVVVQRLQSVPGVSRVRVWAPRFAMRLWVDPDRLAAYSLTVSDIERSLRQQNVDIPSGRIESVSREFGMRLEGRMNNVSDYENLVLTTRGDTQVKFSDVGRVELGSSDYRVQAFYLGRTAVGMQVQKQTQANLLQLAEEVKALLPEMRRNLPEGVELDVAYDTSVFVQRSVDEVFNTLYIAGGLVVLTIFFFLRDWRATVIPLVAIPVSIVGSFAVVQAMGFSLNLLTMLALVLAVGLVVDDAIVMLENIYRRIEEGEGPIHAAIFGARQMAFAVISTTLTLIAVFVPVAFQSGRTGRLFYEFGITLAVAVSVSSLIALTLTPMLCSRLLTGRRDTDGHMTHGLLYRMTEPMFVRFNAVFSAVLGWSMQHKFIVLIAVAAFASTGPWFYGQLQRELTPMEDRGVFRVIMNFPLGSTPNYAAAYAADSEQVLLNTPEVDKMFRITGFGGGGADRGFMFVMLKPWEERTRSTQEILTALRGPFSTNPGGMIIAAPVRPLGGRRSTSGGVELVLVGPEFDQLQQLAAQMTTEMRNSTILERPRISPEPNKPQLNVQVDRARAADLKVPVVDVATTLESLFGGRRVTRFRRGPDEYDVLIQVEDADRTSPTDLGKIYLRSTEGALVQLSNLVDYNEEVVPESYPHFDRQRSVTIQAQLREGFTQGDGVAEFSRIASILPEGYSYTWDGETREFVESSADATVLFGLALVFTFLILAAQFESWIHPITIFTGVVLALTGGVAVLYLSRYWGPGMTDNLFTRFGLIMLIGLVAKNGILIVEFANQLRIEGRNAYEAAFQAATLRFRPILMTAISTILGALPLALASGPGAETRNPMGLAIVGGLTIATFLTLFVIPIFYVLMDRGVMKVTGKSSAHGLVQAAEIEKQVEAKESLIGSGHH